MYFETVTVGPIPPTKTTNPQGELSFHQVVTGFSKCLFHTVIGFTLGIQFSLPSPMLIHVKTETDIPFSSLSPMSIHVKTEADSTIPTREKNQCWVGKNHQVWLVRIKPGSPFGLYVEPELKLKPTYIFLKAKSNQN